MRYVEDKKNEAFIKNNPSYKYIVTTIYQMHRVTGSLDQAITMAAAELNMTPADVREVANLYDLDTEFSSTPAAASNIGESVNRVMEASLDSIMKKVRAGKDLSDEDEKVVSAALDAVDDDDKDVMDKIMKKVRSGKDLTDAEEKKMAAYLDSSKSKDESYTVEIQEDFHIPGTDTVLEKGDRIQILSESAPSLALDLFEEIYADNVGNSYQTGQDMTRAIRKAAAMYGGDTPVDISELFSGIQDGIKTAR